MNSSPNDPAQDARGAFPQFEKRILDTSSVGVMITRLADGTILYANPATARLFGVTSIDVIVGKLVPDFYWDANDRITVLNRLRTEGSVSGYDLRARRNDESMIWVSISVQPFDYAGEPAALSEIADISLRKQAEDELERNVNFTNVLLDAVPTPVFYKDKEGVYQGCNRAFTELMGRSAEEIRGKTVHELWPGENAEVYHQKDLDLMRSREHQVYEAFVTDKDGSARPVIFAKDVFFDEAGDVAGLVGAFVDITERRNAEEERLRLQSVMEQIGDGIALADLAGNILYANPAWAKMHGYELDEIIGKSLSIFHTREQLEQDVVPFNEKVMATGLGTDEIGHVRKDGTTFPTLMTTAVQKDRNGAPVGLIGTIRDITESKQAEAAVLEEKKISDATINSMPGIFYMFDVQGNLIRWNKNYETVMGYSTEEISSRNALDAIADEDKERTGQGIQQAFTEGNATLEALLQTRQGIKIPYLFSALRMSIDNNMYVVGTGFDVSERKQLESQIQQAFERRGFQVQISTEIAQELAAATKLDELFGQVVTLTKERLNYYHTQLLRYDPVSDAVVLIKGYGETGRKMLAGGHKMPMGSGLIGTAAATGETVLRPTLTDDPDWRPNPLLPETQGEIAVPIKLGDQVLGVLDVQSSQTGALTEDDRLLLEGLCGQIAIAIRSTELLETIHQNETRLAEAATIAQLGYWEFDALTDTYTFTDQFYALLRTTAEREGGYQMSSREYASRFMHPDDRHLVSSEIQKSIETFDADHIEQFENRFIRADGSEGYVTGRSRVVKDAQGRTVKTIGFNQDITERKQAEARLAEALGTARLAYWEYDVEKDLFTFNDQFYAIFHATAEKAGGYQISSARYAELFVHPEDIHLVGAEIGKALSSTERVYTTALDHRILYADGGVGHITVRVTVERDENGKVTRFYGANQDITERKTAEEALQRSQQEMAERLDEINRLYQAMSREGWKTYRQTKDLPTGFMFDRNGVQPVDDPALAGERFTHVPMKVLGGEVVGNLAVADDPEHPISKDDLDFLQQVSEQVALALEGARLSAQTQSALEQTEKLYEASRAITATHDEIETVTELVKRIDHTSLDRVVAAMKISDVPVTAHVVAVWDRNGMEDRFIGNRFTDGQIPLISKMHWDEATLINDFDDASNVDLVTQKTFKALGVKSAAILPISSSGNLIGWILLETTRAPRQFGAEVPSILALAGQAATVIQGQRLLVQSQKQADRESTLNVISQKIQSATTVEAVLQIAARELGHALGAPMTIAQLSMKDRK